MTKSYHRRRLDELMKTLESLDESLDKPNDLSDVKVDRGIPFSNDYSRD